MKYFIIFSFCACDLLRLSDEKNMSKKTRRNDHPRMMIVLMRQSKNEYNEYESWKMN